MREVVADCPTAGCVKASYDGRKPASLLNHDSLSVDDATDCMLFPVPIKANPCVRFGSDNVPTFAKVEDAYPNEPSVVEEFPNVWSALQTFAVYLFAIVVDA